VFSLANADDGAVALADETGCEFTYEHAVPQANGKLRGFFTTRGVSPEVVREYAPNLPVDELELLLLATDMRVKHLRGEFALPVGENLFAIFAE
jgi:hypothetical protein